MAAAARALLVASSPLFLSPSHAAASKPFTIPRFPPSGASLLVSSFTRAFPSGYKCLLGNPHLRFAVPPGAKFPPKWSSPLASNFPGSKSPQMNKDQASAWLEAQGIDISEDLVAAARRQLAFLLAVDRLRCLYDGPLLDRAICRYKACWLPLLAKHCECGVTDGSLYVPLDCEWIWHCHRLNPVQYKKDCEETFGRILNNHDVKSSLQGNSKHEMTEKWSRLYPEEPFELDCSSTFSEEILDKYPGAASIISYDLVSAVKRQSSFCYQFNLISLKFNASNSGGWDMYQLVSRPSMHDNRVLEAAVNRYKGFLHLIKKNQDGSKTLFCVPTYDIDLIWHSHQLHPASYCNDMIKLLGKVLEHDDTDSDRSKGKKLDVGFSETTKQWEDTYGLRYWRAGTMYRGKVPSQVLLEIVEVKNLPDSQKGDLFVSFSKKKPDMLFYGGTLSIQSESGKKHVASFKCEPTGELILVLMSKLNSKICSSRRASVIGTTSISLQDLMNPDSELSIEKWFELKSHSRTMDTEPVCLWVAVSFTVPVPAPFEFRMFKTHPISTNTCFLPLSGKEMFTSWTSFLDHRGDEVIRLCIRNLKKSEGSNTSASEKKVVGISRLWREQRLLAEYVDNRWSLNDYNFSLVIEKIKGQDGSILEIKGDHQMKLFLGKGLEYEPNSLKERNDKEFFTTLVELSAENPYGKAVALFDMKSSSVEVNEERFVLLGVLLAFLLKDIIKRGKEKTPCSFSTKKMQKRSPVPSVEAVKHNSERGLTQIPPWQQ
ncbi:hypothetical protein MUK42_02034 [Musa troglodytarum]|uniref:Uncharacterized protein n=1 Tax=Musa troglodytarum TaxID=320322 RepID=A0A9E7EPL9_9LILI|nr:hypothetical protein MUK42_02034 [Musa troglodytarum]